MSKNPASSPVSRRRFIQGVSLAATSAALAGGSQLLGRSTATGGGGPARNLIFLVADGMGGGTLSLAHHWSLRNHGKPLNWNQLYGRKGVTHALQDTASASSPVTDSSAASSAWGIGERINNGAVNITPDGRQPEPILLRARRAGKATGLVTTCTVTHATPAGFAANMTSRNSEAAIARQYIDREIDVLLGGGLRHFRSSATEDSGDDLLAEAKAKDYQLLRSKSDLARRDKKQQRLLGLFANDHIPYVIDRENDPQLAEIPSLETLFQGALDTLAQAPNGFALQVEAGRIDHAAHANDPAAVLRETLEFDRCIAVATEFQRTNPDTLVIITADHGTGGCQLNGIGAGYNDSGPALERINRITASFDALQRRFQAMGGFDGALFQQATGLAVTLERQAALKERIAEGTQGLERIMLDVFAEDLKQTTGIGWSSGNHTSEMVELFAFGPGAQAIPGFVRNEQLFPVMMEALRVRV